LVKITSQHEAGGKQLFATKTKPVFFLTKRRNKL